MNKENLSGNKEFLVSVIIPIHNRSEDLKRSIPSVLAQTHSHLEVLVIDDASTEDLSFVIASFNDSRIRHVRNEVKGNASSVRNTGIKEASGKYIAFLDSDDEWLPNHLVSRIDQLESRGVDGVFGSTYIFDGDEDTFVFSPNLIAGQHPINYILGNGFMQPSSWVMVAESVKNVLFNPELRVNEDYDFFIRFWHKYKWLALTDATSRVYWIRGVQRLRNPKSEIEFVQKYYSNVGPKNYFNHCLTQLGYYRTNGGQKSVIEYYRAECLRNINDISFNDFCSVFNERKGIAGFITNWIQFSGLMLWRKLFKPTNPHFSNN